MLNMVYAGQGTNSFCVEQTIKSYERQVDNKQVLIKKVDEQDLYSVMTEQGPTKKWLTFPGGHGPVMAGYLPEMAVQKIQSIWNREASDLNNLDLIGICAGAIVLGGCKDTMYGQLRTTHLFKPDATGDGLQITPFLVASPAFPYDDPLDPANCRRVKVIHTSSALNSTFNSCVWLGPGFPRADWNANVEIIRKIKDDVCISVEDPYTHYADHELHDGKDLPIAILYANKGHKAFSQADHIEFDPQDLNESLYEESYSSYRESLINMKRKDQAEKEYKPKKQRFLKIQQELLASDHDRIAALRDELNMMDMPLK
jgi:glutamine amidotransferase-like uncharacterized protein